MAEREATKKKDDMKVVNIKIDSGLHFALKKCALEEDMNLADIISKALAQYMGMEKDEKGKWIEVSK